MLKKQDSQTVVASPHICNICLALISLFLSLSLRFFSNRRPAPRRNQWWPWTPRTPALHCIMGGESCGRLSTVLIYFNVHILHDVFLSLWLENECNVVFMPSSVLSALSLHLYTPCFNCRASIVPKLICIALPESRAIGMNKRAWMIRFIAEMLTNTRTRKIFKTLGYHETVRFNAAGMVVYF